MRVIRRGVRVLVCVACALAVAAPLAAQTPAAQPAQEAPFATVTDAMFVQVWQRVSNDLATQLAGATTPEARRAVYREVLTRFVHDPVFTALRSTPAYQDGLRRLVLELPDSALAQSSNAPLTNPASNELIERSGATQLIALATDLRKVFSADESAVSVNLNAIALVGGGRAAGETAQHFYARREHVKRLSGTVTFGAKVPEKAITGLSGLPRANDLFDAIAWDVKARVFGDRDPLATRWYPLLLGSMGQQTELLARLMGLPIDPADIGVFRAAANDVLGAGLTAARDRIASSLQVSVKGSGVHLTEEAGRNRYSVAAFVDKGFNGVDVTINTSYNVSDVPLEGATDPFRSKDVQVAAGLSTSVLKDLIVRGRDLELSASVQGRVFVDDSAVPIDRKNTFKLNGTLFIPFQLNGKIPISITWTNDPNNLAKEKYVTGQIGLSYDFAAIWNVLKTP